MKVDRIVHRGRAGIEALLVAVLISFDLALAGVVGEERPVFGVELAVVGEVARELCGEIRGELRAARAAV
ncbi:MAG: hypothetical protein NTY23_13430, partial [Chloroflexi bacterium]|nr:hypothetical protein [Chloroflexota bacterium]